MPLGLRRLRLFHAGPTASPTDFRSRSGQVQTTAVAHGRRFACLVPDVMKPLATGPLLFRERHRDLAGVVCPVRIRLIASGAFLRRNSTFRGGRSRQLRATVARFIPSCWGRRHGRSESGTFQSRSPQSPPDQGEHKQEQSRRRGSVLARRFVEVASRAVRIARLHWILVSTFIRS